MSDALGHASDSQGQVRLSPFFPVFCHTHGSQCRRGIAVGESAGSTSQRQCLLGAVWSTSRRLEFMRSSHRTSWQPTIFAAMQVFEAVGWRNSTLAWKYLWLSHRKTCGRIASNVVQRRDGLLLVRWSANVVWHLQDQSSIANIQLGWNGVQSRSWFIQKGPISRGRECHVSSNLGKVDFK